MSRLIDESMIDQRAEEACYANFQDPKYDELMDKSNGIEKRLEAMVCKKHKDDYFKLREGEYGLVEHQRQMIELKLSYKQGFMDGLEIAVLLLKEVNSSK
jgi:hypothetical protein